jgi:hypothetical protein
LCINAEVAHAVDPQQPAFSYTWLPYNPSIPEEFCELNEREIKQIEDIQRLLMMQINSSDDTLNNSNFIAGFPARTWDPSNLSHMVFPCKRILEMSIMCL